MNITTPLTNDIIKNLNIKNNVTITGKIYTARDAAHKKIVECIDNNKSLPFDLKGQIIYYTGPTPSSKPDQIIGSAGPTTSGRMDVYTPILLKKGLKGMIGKGERNNIVKKAIIKNTSIYFIAVGGAGALLSKCIISSKIIAYPELGPEAIRELTVKNFPVIVANDSFGKDIFELGIKKYSIF